MLPGNKSDPVPCPRELEQLARRREYCSWRRRRQQTRSAQPGGGPLSLFLGAHAWPVRLCQPRRLHEAITGSRGLRVLLESWRVTGSQGSLKVKRRWHPRVWFKCSCERAAAQSGNPREEVLGEIRPSQTRPRGKQAGAGSPVGPELASLPRREGTTVAAWGQESSGAGHAGRGFSELKTRRHGRESRPGSDAARSPGRGPAARRGSPVGEPRGCFQDKGTLVLSFHTSHGFIPEDGGGMWQVPARG